MKTVLLTGGTGFIGTPLVAKLQSNGYQLRIIARHSENRDVISLDLTRELIPAELLESVTAIIHLAGAPIFQRWNAQTKQTIYDSRIISTRNIVTSLRQAKQHPNVFITASATGYYGDKGESIIDESASSGNDFLAHVCRDWENEARQAEVLGIRTAQIRTAPVLGNGGILTQLAPWYKWGLGSIWGSGQQWFPWISLADIVAVYCTALEQTDISGPVNAVAPQITRQETFSRILAKQFRHRWLFRIPKWMLQLILGEFGTSLLNSQHVVPQQLRMHGFAFQNPTAHAILKELVPLITSPAKVTS